MATRAEKAAAAKAECLKKIKTYDSPDREMVEGLTALIAKVAPNLELRLWYGMPAWTKDDKVIIFFQSGIAFKTRYCTVGFQPAANLDDGVIWPTSYALTKLTKAAEKQIAEILKVAIS